jgi:hypothetical protein
MGERERERGGRERERGKIINKFFLVSTVNIHFSKIVGKS